MSGWPLRPARSSFGQTYEDSTPVRDPRKQIAAATLNLDFWQVAGLGLVSPRAVLHFTGAASPILLARAEAWNPNQLSTGDYADPTVVVNGAGDYTWTYPTPVPDELGVYQAISFLWALAFTVNDAPDTLKHAQAAIDTTNRNKVRVCSYSAAPALEHGNNLVVLLW